MADEMIDWASDAFNTPAPWGANPNPYGRPGSGPSAVQDPRDPIAARLPFGSRWGALMFAIPGFAQGWGQTQHAKLQREQLDALQEDRARRAQAEDFDTLGKIISSPAEYRDVLFDYWGKQKGGGKLTPELEAYKGLMKKADDDTATLLQEVFGELSAGLKDNKLDIRKVQSIVKDPIKAMELIQRWAAAKKGQEDQRLLAEASTIGGVVPSSRYEAPIDTGRPVLPGREPGTSATEETITIEVDGRFLNIPTIVRGQRVSPDEAVQLFRSGQNSPVGDYPTLESAVTAARSRSDRIGQVRGLGGGVSSGQQGAIGSESSGVNTVQGLEMRRAAISRILPRLEGDAAKRAESLIKTIDDRLDRLTGVTGGFNESIEGPDGQEIKVRFNAMGEPVNILGKARSQWEITEAGGKKVMVEKGPKGRVVEIGPVTPPAGAGSMAERIAAARVAYQRDPSPENKAALDQANEALKVETDLARAKAITVNVGRPMAAEQIKTVAEMEGKVASIDDLLTTIDANPDLKKVIGPGVPWMRRKFGEFVGEPVQIWGTKFGVTPDQREFLANLATVSGELRRFQAGLTQTAYEIAKTAPSLPDEGDPMEGVIGKLRAYRGWLVRNRKSLQGVLEGSGVRAPGMNVAPAPKGGGGGKPGKTSVNLGGRMYEVEAVP